MVQSELKKQFSHMNNMQQQAVFCTEGPLLILAGAGSGKTTVLVNRIAYILQSELCKPWQILAITFTNKAAGELKERICNAVPEGGSDIWAATFHSTCARILRRYGDRIGFTSHFTVYGTDDQKKLVKDILKQLNYDEKMLPVKRVLNEISKAKDKMLTPQEMLKRAGYDNLKQSVAKVYEIYQSRLKTADAMDFDDMLCKTVELFQKCPDILEFYQNQFKYIMVDEYQDTNKVQYKFVSMLAAKYGNICVVGDDDQSIYKFRGATIENILSFENTFKGAKMIRLEQNYRSTQNILNAANGVISNNTMRKGKTLWTENAVGDKIEVHTSDSERDEAQFIAKTILDGVADGRKFSDFAILYRMNAQSNSIEQALSRSGIPHRVIGGRRFYDREEIRDMVAYLQVINNPHDDVRLGRIINVPKRGIGATTLEKASEIAAGLGESIYSVIKDADVYPQLSRAATKLKSFVALIDGLMEAEQSGDYSLAELYNLILEHTDYEKYLKTEKDNPDVRIENIEELSSNIIKFEEDYAEEASLSNFLEEISLQTDIDNYDAEADSSVMMTLHSAKGLEFPVVFIAGLEEGVFPSIATMMNPDELNEERRLAYVGITRAQSELTMTCARRRMVRGETQYNKVSRFVREIPRELVNLGRQNEFGISERRSRLTMEDGFGSAFSSVSEKKSTFSGNTSFIPRQFTVTKADTLDYTVGDIVRHVKFGVGEVTDIVDGKKDYEVTVNFDQAGVKKMFASFAKLKKV